MMSLKTAISTLKNTDFGMFLVYVYYSFKTHFTQNKFSKSLLSFFAYLKSDRSKKGTESARTPRF